MSNSKEISQLASFVSVDENVNKIAITTTSNPYVGIGTAEPTSKLDVMGDINSSTDVKIDGVSVLTTASADAVALAIALG